LTRADAQALNLRVQPFDLQLLVRTRVDILASLAAQRQVKLQVIGPGDNGTSPPLVLADPDRVAQILDNLLENAIRHSLPGQTVTITLTPAEQALHCAVTDTGSGIPARHQPFIFERFYRADAARSRQSGNSGLGLAIARTLVLAQYGQIVAQSQEGQGTVITFSLPLSQN
jgi:signal transduction histidine kinase